MDIKDIILPAQTFAGLHASDKAQLLQEIGHRAARALNLDTNVIIGPLLDRERLGSTGVGAGIALPHARIGGLDRPFGLFARLDRPIDFASVDERPVDLVFLLLTPSKASSNEHLAALACVSRRLRQREVADALRTASSAEALYLAITGLGARSP